MNKRLCFSDRYPCPPPSNLHLFLILRDVSLTHVCECQWKAARWLFYELHYWFPILLRAENVIMYRPPPHHLPQTHLLSFPSLAFLSFTRSFFINLSFIPAFCKPPPHPLTSPDLSMWCPSVASWATLAQFILVHYFRNSKKSDFLKFLSLKWNKQRDLSLEGTQQESISEIKRLDCNRVDL